MSEARLLIISQAASSMGNLVLTLGLSRSGDADLIGACSVSLSIYVLGSGFLRSAIFEPSLVGTVTVGSRRRRVLLVLAIVATVIGIVAQVQYPGSASLFAVSLGACVGYVVDLYRYAFISNGETVRAVWIDLTWTGFAIIGLVIGEVIGRTASIAALGWLFGASAAVIVGYLTFPLGVATGKSSYRIDYLSGLDQILSSGITPALTLLVAARADLGAAGIFRMACVIASPIGTLGVALRPAFFRRGMSGSTRHDVTYAYSIGGLFVSLLLAYQGVVFLLGEGPRLMLPGMSVLGPVAASYAFGSACIPALARLRIGGESSRILRLRAFAAAITLGGTYCMAQYVNLSEVAWLWSSVAGLSCFYLWRRDAVVMDSRPQVKV